LQPWPRRSRLQMVASRRRVAIVMQLPSNSTSPTRPALKGLGRRTALLNPVYPLSELAPLVRPAAPARRPLCRAADGARLLNRVMRDLGIPNVVLAWGKVLPSGGLVAESRQLVGPCGLPPPCRTSEYCCSGAAPLELQGCRKTHTWVVWHRSARSGSTVGRRGTNRESSSQLRPSLTSYGFHGRAWLVPVSAQGET